MTVFNLMKRNQSLSRTWREYNTRDKEQAVVYSTLEARPPWRGPGRMCQCRALAAAPRPLCPCPSTSSLTQCSVDDFSDRLCRVHYIVQCRLSVLCVSVQEIKHFVSEWVLGVTNREHLLGKLRVKGFIKLGTVVRYFWSCVLEVKSRS